MAICERGALAHAHQPQTGAQPLVDVEADTVVADRDLEGVALHRQRHLYVGQEISPAMGYLTGWSMVMDYMLNPIICTIWCSQQAHVFAPGIPYAGSRRCPRRPRTRVATSCWRPSSHASSSACSPRPFPNVGTAFVHAAGRAWMPLFPVVGFTLLLANFGSGMGAQLGAARLLYGMGRSNALPKAFFGVVDPKPHIPRNNIRDEFSGAGART